MQHTALGEGLTVISRRVLEFTLLADAIVNSDESTLAELAVQLHAPVSKLRMWGSSWRRLFGQHEAANVVAAGLPFGVECLESGGGIVRVVWPTS